MNDGNLINSASKLKKMALTYREAAKLLYLAADDKDRQQKYLDAAADKFVDYKDSEQMLYGLRSANIIDSNQIKILGDDFMKSSEDFERYSNEIQELTFEERVFKLSQIEYELKDQNHLGSILKALEDKNSDLALIRLRGGGNLYEYDQYGNVPLHYAAANNYIDLLKEIISHKFPVRYENNRRQTPLILAMDYGQFEAAKVLWSLEKEEYGNPAKGFTQLLFELCDIGVNQRTLKNRVADSGFFQLNTDGKVLIQERAKEIGEELNRLGGIKMMQQVAKQVGSIIGPRALSDLSCIWHGIGGWLN